MLILITGGCKNGKSDFAQRVCMELAEKRKKYYLATLHVRDAEDEKKVESHLKSRAGMDFETIEATEKLPALDKPVYLKSLFLLDSLTLLLANRMFLFDGKNFCFEKDSAQELCKEIINFASKVYCLVVVSDFIYSDCLSYTYESECYRSSLAFIEKELVKVCNSYIEISCTFPLVHKGTCSFSSLQGDKSDMNKEKKYTLIFGGAFQGKQDFAKKRFALNDTELCICSKSQVPDFSKRCICKLENYVYFCLKNNLTPFKDFKEGTILIFTDIYCGLVPIDAFERKWRESSGLYMRELAANSKVYRITCGIGEELS